MTAATAPLPPLAQYYHWHARIYDMTRWTFLFGRRQLIQQLSANRAPRRILEIGCGTGKNLAALARTFPSAQIVGLDLSSDMLERARPKLRGFGPRILLLHQAYEAPVSPDAKFDLIVFSYSLSMINPGHDQVLRICQSDLAPDGMVAAVDFHKSAPPWFRRWMGLNHVRMEGQVLDCLQQDFDPLTCEIKNAYFGLWHFLIFTGKAKPRTPA